MFFFSLLFFSLPWAGFNPKGDLAGNVQVHGLTYEAEPDEKISFARDASFMCDMCHGIRSVARVDKEGRGTRLRMILRNHNELSGEGMRRRGQTRKESNDREGLGSSLRLEPRHERRTRDLGVHLRQN